MSTRVPPQNFIQVEGGPLSGKSRTVVPQVPDNSPPQMLEYQNNCAGLNNPVEHRNTVPYVLAISP